MKKLIRVFAYITIFLIPSYIFRFPIAGIPTNIFEIFVLFLFLLTFCFLLSSQTKIIFGTVWPYLFCLVALVSVFFSADKIDALGILKSYFLVPALFYFSIINLFERKDLASLALPISISLFLVTLWGLLQYFGLVRLLFYQVGDTDLTYYLAQDNFRLFGPFESPNFLAMFIVPMLFLSLPTVLSAKKNLLRWSLVGLIVSSVFVLWLTGSRAGIIALIASVIAVLIIQGFNDQDKRKRVKNMIFSLIIIFFAALSFLSNPSLGDRSGSDSSRKQIWGYSLQMIRINPIAGIGLGGFYGQIDKLSADDQEFRLHTLSYSLHPHNIFLAIWLNLGLAGILLFIFIIYQFFSRIISTLKDDKFTVFLGAAMLAILIHGFVDTTYFKNDLSAIFWLLIAFSVILAKKGKLADD